MGIYKLTSANVATIWGGHNLEKDWGKTLSGDNIAESWIMSARNDYPSRLEDGRTLAEFLSDNPDAAGSRAKTFSDFPILVKLIDAADDLSVQVHPGDDYALANEGQFGKNEMWYILAAEKESGVYCGFKDGVNEAMIENAISEGTLESLLNFYHVKAGDSVFIPAGTVHAIGKGLLLFEIQQNSGVTYRLYDYNRKDKQGNSRELHVKKSLDVLSLAPPPKLNADAVTKGEATRLADCKYFRLDKIELDGEYRFETSEQSFTGLTVIDGNCAIGDGASEISATKGDTFFIPAENGNIFLTGKASIMKYTV